MKKKGVLLCTKMSVGWEVNLTQSPMAHMSTQGNSYAQCPAVRLYPAPDLKTPMYEP